MIVILATAELGPTSGDDVTVAGPKSMPRADRRYWHRSPGTSLAASAATAFRLCVPIPVEDRHQPRLFFRFVVADVVDASGTALDPELSRRARPTRVAAAAYSVDAGRSEKAVPHPSLDEPVACRFAVCTPDIRLSVPPPKLISINFASASLGTKLRCCSVRCPTKRQRSVWISVHASEQTARPESRCNRQVGNVHGS